MADGIEIVAEGRTLEVDVTGKLTKEFYQELAPAVDQQIKQNGKLRILFVMNDFHGWTAGALWEDVSFAWHHFSDTDRLAIVGESRWAHGMAVFYKPFTAAKVRYYDASKVDEAAAWIHEGVGQPVPSA